jgi:hypothetical protein
MVPTTAGILEIILVQDLAGVGGCTAGNGNQYQNCQGNKYFFDHFSSSLEQIIWMYFASIHELGRFANLQALNRILNHPITRSAKRGIAFLVNLLQTILGWPFRLAWGACRPGRYNHLSCAGESDDKNPMRDQEPVLTKPGT